MGGSDAWPATARLLRRVAFGATGDEVDAVARTGRAGWLADALTADPRVDPGSLATPAPGLQDVPTLSSAPSRSERRSRNAALRRQRDLLATWWVRRMVATGTPVVERLTFGWHHLFATDLRVVRDARMMLVQNEVQRATGRSSYSDLLGAMLTDSALLTYLNGSASTAGTRNENLARELLEVFTLGRSAGWTEHDVEESARALTGWSVDDAGTARYTPSWHDGGTKTVLGRTGRLDRTDLVQTLLSHPAAAPHLLGRWWSVLVSSTSPTVPAGVQRRALAAYGPRHDVGALLQSLLTDPEVEALAPSLVRPPVDWLVGAARALRVTLDDEAAQTAVTALRALGQEPFCPPNVGGWPTGRAWLSTGAAESRLATAGWLAGLADLDVVASAAPSRRVDAVAHLLGLPSFSDRTLVGLRTQVRDPAALVATALVSPENLVV